MITRCIIDGAEQDGCKCMREVAPLHSLPMAAITVLFSMFTVDETQLLLAVILCLLFNAPIIMLLFFVVGH